MTRHPALDHPGRDVDEPAGHIESAAPPAPSRHPWTDVTPASYVSRVVREWVASPNPDALHRRLDGTMVFVDISGFTKMSDRLARLGKRGAEEITAIVSSCFDRLVADAHAFGGTLVKFGGDALLLFFQGERHARRAAAAALEMRRTLHGTRVFETVAGKVQLSMTVGVHSGEFDFFLVGRSHRELIIAGPAASELVAVESSAQTGRILVSTACARELSAANLGPEQGRGRLLRGRLDAAVADACVSDVTGDLAPFVPRAVTEAIRGHGRLESEHRHVTVAFLHLQGLDRRIAHGDLDAVADDLDRLVRAVQDAADRRDVCFLATDIAADGTKVILTAGAPRSAGHDEESMLLALRAVVDSAPAIPVRIGVNTGSVFAGEIDTSDWRTYTVMGDPVNVAARIMGKARAGEILAAAPVLDRSRTLFTTEWIDPFSVKGKRQPLVAGAVGPARGTRVEVAADFPMVGRHAELELLAEAAAAAR
ncbi:MAG TPA: adenylate/guanylate cyclase domain-containing protein, partial [Desertimonas sp.]|nr:adenylate/guanylate cyclase domain-containing protein [Desertimonas sp.]